MTITEEELDMVSAELKELAKKRQSLIIEQSIILENRIDDYRPFIDFVRDNHYRFTHPNEKIKASYVHGPILSLDEKEDLVFAYNCKSNKVAVIRNTSRSEVEELSTFEYAGRYGIKDAIESLVFINEIPGIILTSVKKDNEEREEEIEKYK